MSLEIHQNIKEKLEYFNSIHKIPNIIFNGPDKSLEDLKKCLKPV